MKMLVTFHMKTMDKYISILFRIISAPVIAVLLIDGVTLFECHKVNPCDNRIWCFFKINFKLKYISIPCKI